RVADLHRARARRLALVRQRVRAERRAVDPVAAGATADEHDPVFRTRRLLDPVQRYRADRPAVDARVPDVAWLLDNGAGDRREVHAVPVVGDARDDSGEETLRVDRAGRHVLVAHVEVADAEDVDRRDRPGAEAGAEDVADHAAHAGARAAIRLD